MKKILVRKCLKERELSDQLQLEKWQEQQTGLQSRKSVIEITRNTADSRQQSRGSVERASGA